MSANTELLRVDRARRDIAEHAKRMPYRIPQLTDNQRPCRGWELVAAWATYLIGPATIVAAVAWHAAFGVSLP